MRYLVAFMCVLALGVMGCSETAGTGGDGGIGGNGGVGGDGGMGAEGGNGGSVVTDCTGFESAGGVCVVTDCSAAEDGTDCIGQELIGLCVAGSCEMLERCENDEFCRDYNDCRADTCLSNGLCEEGGPMQDGTPCAGGTCQGGECALTTAVLPCTEQGVRNAIAAGGGPYTFACDGPTTVVTAAAIAIDNDVILDGESKLVLDGNEDHGVFGVAEGVTAELRGLTATRGLLGIGNGGTLMLTNSTVSGNTASGRDGGGGIFNFGTLMLTDSTVSGNTGRSRGGGIHNTNRGVLTLTNSIVSGNSANGGGGIFNDRGTVTLTNSTVSGNTATSFPNGGISIAQSEATLTNSTVSGNTGRAIFTQFGPVTLTNSVVDGDCEIAPCCPGGDIVSNGYNIESPSDTCGFDHEGDQAGVSAALLDLQPLADNGGPTQTHAITTDSAAFNAGTCEVDTDQRGQPRPETGGTMCDVGVFEVQPAP